MLTAVTERDAYANLLLAAALRERGLHGQDAALATELVYGTLRNRGCYDAIIGLCADRELDQIDPPVLDVLRLGAHQLLGMRVKAHAAVATTVDLAIAVAGRRPAGFVNAVLRRIAPRDLESWIEIAAPDRDSRSCRAPVGQVQPPALDRRRLRRGPRRAAGDGSAAEPLQGRDDRQPTTDRPCRRPRPRSRLTRRGQRSRWPPCPD